MGTLAAQGPVPSRTSVSYSRNDACVQPTSELAIECHWPVGACALPVGYKDIGRLCNGRMKSDWGMFAEDINDEDHDYLWRLEMLRDCMDVI